MVHALGRLQPSGHQHNLTVDCGSGVATAFAPSSAQNPTTTTTTHLQHAASTANLWSEAYCCRSTLVSDASEAFRKEAERIDHMEGAVIYHSLGGGCAGVACSFLEELRDCHVAPFVAHCVLDGLPHFRSPCERMNCAFTTLWIQRLSDLVIHVDAAEVLQRSEVSRGNANAKVLMPKDVPQQAAMRMESIFVPKNRLSDAVVHMVPLCCSRVVTVSSVLVKASAGARASVSWQEMARRKLHVPQLGRPMTLATMAVARGFRSNLDRELNGERGAHHADIQALLKRRIAASYRQTSVNPRGFRFANGPGMPKFNSLALAINCPAYTASLFGSVLEQADVIRSAGAYRHLYEKELERDTIRAAFDALKDKHNEVQEVVKRLQ